MVRQASRYATAARQDANPLIAILHANYAFGIVNMLRQLATDRQILHVAGVSGDRLERRMAEIQDWAAGRFTPYVPDLVPHGILAGRSERGS